MVLGRGDVLSAENAGGDAPAAGALFPNVRNHLPDSCSVKFAILADPIFHIFKSLVRTLAPLYIM
jgi:hypothetical protein